MDAATPPPSTHPPPEELHMMNTQPTQLIYKTWVLKVSIHCVGCKRKVKRVLHTIEGVYTVDIDSKQHKVTVVGNVEVDTLIKKLIKTGKHAEKWPSDQNPNKKDKTTGDKDGSESSGNTTDEDQADNNNNPPPAGADHNNRGNTPSSKPTVKFAENNQLQPTDQQLHTGGSAGGGGGNKKKKKKKKSKKGSGSAGAKPASGGAADTGLIAPAESAGSTQVVDQHQHQHLGPPGPGGYSYPMPGVIAPPAYAVCYSETHPSGNGGPAYYIPPTPYSSTYDYEEEENININDDFVTLSRPSNNTFELLSDENPYACYLM